MRGCVRFHPYTYIYQYIMTELTARSFLDLHTLPAWTGSTATLTIFVSFISRDFLSPLNVQTKVSHLRIHYLMSHTHIIIGILMYSF
jgi:hypothetical protein